MVIDQKFVFLFCVLLCYIKQTGHSFGVVKNILCLCILIARIWNCGLERLPLGWGCSSVELLSRMHKAPSYRVCGEGMEKRELFYLCLLHLLASLVFLL